MISANDLDQEVLDLGKAIGLIADNSDLNSDWFADPLEKIKTIISNPEQRAALLRMVDAVLPAVSLAGVPENEKWHPLLGNDLPGNLFLTVKETGDGVELGASGNFGNPNGPGLSAGLRVQLPLISAGTTVNAIAGTSSAPLKIVLTLNLDWVRGSQPIADQPITLKAIVATASVTSNGSSLEVLLKGLALDDRQPQDTILDSNNLGSEAVQLILGLLKQTLHELTATPGSETEAIKQHLLPLFGLDGNGIPALPLAQLLEGPAALQVWFKSMLGGGTPHIKTWLGHLGSLMGAANAVVSGEGSESDPWRVSVIPLASQGALSLTLAHHSDSLHFGLEAAVASSSETSIEGRASVAAIPLNGNGAATVLPSATAAFQVRGAPNLVINPNITVKSLQVGLRWNGSTLQPMLEMEKVKLGTTEYDRLDLTNADSVIDAASDVVRDAIRAALGSGSGSNLAALVGIIAPAADTDPNPPLLDPAGLVSNPSRAISAVHRQRLINSKNNSPHDWQPMLEEIAALLELGSVVGVGTQEDPWRVGIGPASTINVELAAWNAQTSNDPDVPQLLRLGLRASMSSAPLQFAWLVELLAFDLPKSSEGAVSLMAGHHAILQVESGATTPPVAGISIHADSFLAQMDWTASSLIVWRASVEGLSVTVDEVTVGPSTLRFPSASNFDVSDPAATAASFGISVPDFELVLRALIAKAALSWGGMQGFTIAGLLGLHKGLSGFQSDWPTLADPAIPGSLLSDPFSAMRQWLNRIAIDLSTDGSPFLPAALLWLRAILGNSLPQEPSLELPEAFPISGSGTYQDPWALPLDEASQSAEALVWLEPAGPPSNWAASLASGANAAGLETILEVAQSLSAFLPGIAPAVRSIDLPAMRSAIQRLDDHLSNSDGVVPFASQIPTTSDWTAGTPINSPHHLQPKDPSAITQILAQVDELAGGATSPRVVVLLGPAFTDHTIWEDLLAQPDRHGTADPAAHFNLRVPGVNPDAIDLNGVTALVDYYTADLQGDAPGVDAVVRQIGRIVARLGELHPGSQVTLVAHSTAGVAARAFTASNPTLVRGLITLGTPHGGALLPFLTDVGVADALRLIQGLREGMPTPGPLRNALDHIFSALDGFGEEAAAGALPVARPYPIESFAGALSSATGGQPALAIGGKLQDSLIDLLRQAVANLAAEASAGARATPTHIGFGARARLGLPNAGPGDVQVDARVRADVFHVKLRDGVAEPTRSPHALAIQIKINRPGGWLVGAASPFAGVGQPPLDVRVRAAELGVEIEAASEGSVKAVPRLTLHQASIHGPIIQSVDLGDQPAEAQALLGAVMQALTNPAPAATTPVSALINALQSLGVVVPDPHGGFGVSSDAFAAILTDAASFFALRLQAALNSAGGLAGLTGPSGGPWTFVVGAPPIEIQLSRETASGIWRLRFRSTGENGLSLGGDSSLHFDSTTQLPGFALSLDAALKIGGLSLVHSGQQQTLKLEAPPCLPPVTLLPRPNASDLAATLNDLLPNLLFSSSAGAMIEALVGPELRVGPLHCFLAATGDFLSRPSSLGRSDGKGLDSAKLSGLLQAINQIAGFPEGDGLHLPAGFQLTATGDGTEASPSKFVLSTTTPIGGVLGVQLSVSIDRQLHLRPGGTLSLTTDLDGDWPAVTVSFGANDSGVSLLVSPEGVTPIQILPTFSGLGPAFFDATQALLPAALDHLVEALSTPGPQPVWLARFLGVVEALALHDSVGGFKGHANDIRALLSGDWLNTFDPLQRNNVAVKVAELINGVVTLPAPATVTGSTVNVSVTLGGVDAGSINLAVGWDGLGPVANLTVAGLKLGGGPIRADVAAGYAGGAIQCRAGLSVSLQEALRLEIAPKLDLSFTTTGGSNHFNLNFLPLATSSSNGPLRIELAPTPGVHNDSGTSQQVVELWLLPLTAGVVFEAIKSKLNDPVWAGTSLRDALAHAGLIVKGTVPADDRLNSSLPDIEEMVSGLIAGLAVGTGLSVGVSDSLTLSVAGDGSGDFGLRIKGHQDFRIGRFELSARFGAPSEWNGATPGADGGVALLLFRATGGEFEFRPKLSVAGLGLGLTGAEDTPLINTSGFRLGSARLYSFFVAELADGLSVKSLGGGLELDDLGLPLGLATSGNVGGNNPVASNLLQSGGTAGEDPQPVNPGVDVDAWYWGRDAGVEGGDNQFHILFGGQIGTLWIGVQRSFGPIYIDQIGLDVSNTAVAMLIDGSVKVDGLVVQADDLTVLVPYKSILTPSDWELDLRGLAVGFSAPGVSIAGALLKTDGPPVEYAGMLLIQLTKFGFVAVGAYSTPTDPGTGETYTSLFVFAGVFIVIGIPPIIELSGLGLGVGYNRQLLPPSDLNEVPNFPLVKVLDDGGAVANDPMGVLRRIRTQMPAKRGSFWLAVGLRGTSFEIVHVTAIVYVALDRGVEIGLLGVARMSLPSGDTAVVNIEMALKARFSTDEGLLSVQGQLTKNSWLLSENCQLTGGFAYFAWFKRSQFLVTVGGYHAAFRKPPEFPDVPRVGFHWVFGRVTVKGEAYFALTNSCVMLGTRVDVDYNAGWVDAWIHTSIDVLITRDPFHYDVKFHVDVGARFYFEICFIECWTISFSFELGADLHIEGPPFHGSVTVNFAMGSVTVRFGDDPDPVRPRLLWTEFRKKYLQAGDPEATAVTVYVLRGLLMPEPPGGKPAAGTASEPWKMAAEFSFQTETRMPATRTVDFITGRNGPDLNEHLGRVDIAPMRVEGATGEHFVTLEVRRGNTWNLIGFDPFGAVLDPSQPLDPQRFRIKRIIGQVSEATYRCFEPDDVPAAANTLAVIAGIKITGIAKLQGKSATIPIAKLVDPGNSRPLPFATLTLDLITALQEFGQAAELLSGVTASASSEVTISASKALLAGAGFFSRARADAGLPAAGLTLNSTRSLERYRSAPPLITPITTGLTMNPVGQPLPPAIKEVAPDPPIVLDSPRLRAVLQNRPQPTVDSPPAPRTTVKRITRTGVEGSASIRIEEIPRMAAPRPTTLAGARLEFIRAANAPRATSLASSGRTLRNIETGWLAGGAQMAAFRSAEKDIMLEGVTLVAGATHIWEVPQLSGLAIEFKGDAAARVTLMTRGGQVLDDREVMAQGGGVIKVPDRCGMIAVTCLGRVGPSREVPAGGLGSVSFAVAPQRKSPVVGWQLGSLLQQVSSTTFLGRGTVLVVPQTHVSFKDRQATSQATVKVSEAMVNQLGVETWLPIEVGVVGVVLDQQDTCAAAEGDFSIAAIGAKLQTPPLRVEGGRRKLLLYDVAKRDGKADRLVVALSSAKGSRFAGVVGLPGRAQEWATRMNGGVPEDLVGDGPLTPDGQLNVRIVTVPE